MSQGRLMQDQYYGTRIYRPGKINKGVLKMTKNFVEARKKLINACEGYIKHNQRELDGLKAISHVNPAYTFFQEALDKYEPDLGFRDWICCQYFDLLKCILFSFNGCHDPYNYYCHYSYPFNEMKWWFQSDMYDEYYEEFDQSNPAIVLHNLRALFNLLNFHMEKSISQLEQKKIALDYKENDLSNFSEACLSIQIYKTLENLKLRAPFAESIMEKSFQTGFLLDVYKTIEEASPVYEGYLKGVAVKELKATLENPALNDREAIKAVEEQLKNGITLELLSKNRQSQRERDLKFLSIISICIGIGVFTTLGLVCKRLYDSGGTSINFFKPLSQNLYETIESITEDLEEETDCACN